MDTTIEFLYSVYCKHPVVCTDTRNLKKDSIFFALKGENFNGNKFAEQALNEGCSYAIIDQEEYKKSEKHLLVPDVLKALQELACFHRKQLAIPVIAITGSNGKTTTKELVYAVLGKKYNVLATKGNLNNHIGVPLTLLSIAKEHQIAVIEMGANHIGEIAQLCRIAEPDFGIITNIGRAHLEGFGGAEGVIKAKRELYNFIKQRNGTLFVNSNNALLMELSEGINKVLYGTKANCNCIGKLVDSSPFVQLKWKLTNDADIIDKKEAVATQLLGKYNFENILAAVCIASYFKVEQEQIKEAIQNYIPSNNRSQIVQKNSNTILLDAYNANPTSMSAALENFSEMKVNNKVVILGDMLELGENSRKEHQLIIEQIKHRGFSSTILIGPFFSEIEDSIHAERFKNADDALLWLKDRRIENSTVLIKGSRGMKLEKLIEAL